MEGNQYYFKVYAINEVGESLPVESEPITAKLPFDPPGPPINLKAEDITKSTAKITWEAPEFDGGSPVTGYYVEKNLGKRWSKLNKKATKKPELNLDDLIEGETYEVRAVAENLAGVGTPCDPITFVAKDPFTVPGQPGAPEVLEMTPDGVKLSWAKPESDGGAPIESYIVEMKKKSDAKWSPVKKDVPDTECTVPAIAPDEEYMFRVVAVNKAGKGPASLPTPAKYSESFNLIFV